MMKKILLLLGIFFGTTAYSQIVINEVDSDTPSTDLLEFVELKTSTPNMSLDGYVVVFYNGSNDLSYSAFDLDGFTSDANGLFLLGNQGVSPTPSIVFPSNTLQNGPDAVAVFQADASDFPNGTAISTTNLIDVIVYDTNDADDAQLLQGFGVTTQYNEGAAGDKDNHSNQRKSDGTYEAKLPTPKAPNDGGGNSLPSITISTTASEYTEGSSFDITFTVSEAPTANLILNFSITEGNFTTNDYSGATTVTINSGTTTSATTITLVDDTESEDLEMLVVKFINLDADYQAQNDNYSVTILDNDLITSPWGSPLQPTYNQVNSTAPQDYYASLIGKSGQALKDAITAIIANPSTVRAQTYGDVWDIIKEADVNPENNYQVWLVYTELGRSKSLQQGTGTSVGRWNREHIYPQSRGGFSGGTSSAADGMNVYMTTSASHIEHGHSDAHHIRPADSGENSSRSNNDFGVEYNGPTGNSGSWKGDIARSVMYMTLRYNGLSVVAGNPDNSTVGQLGDLTTLLAWCAQDPPDDYEMNRNNVIYQWQNNRNPFIDLPELYEYVYGSKTNQVWNGGTLSTPKTGSIFQFVNPVHEVVRFHQNLEGIFTLYNFQGRKILSQEIQNNQVNVSQVSTGFYVYHIRTSDASYKGKLIKN